MSYGLLGTEIPIYKAALLMLLLYFIPFEIYGLKFPLNSFLNTKKSGIETCAT